MVSKKEKVRDINVAIKRSSVAKERKAKAEIIGSRIEYSMMSKSSRPYRMKVSFMDTLGLLEGEDIRKLHKKYGR